MVNEFLQKYGYPEWPVKYRPGVPFTTGFGIDDTFGQIRIHAATDRGSSPPYIYAPFDIKSASWELSGGGFGSILRLKPVGADFEIRIMHTEKQDLEPTLIDCIENGTVIESTTLIAKCGRLGTGTGPHTHTEIVSLFDRSQILDSVLYKISHDLGNEINNEYVYRWIRERNRKQSKNGKPIIDVEKNLVIFQSELGRRRIEQLTENVCIRKDYIDGYKTTRTFYNSKTVFNGL